MRTQAQRQQANRQQEYLLLAYAARQRTAAARRAIGLINRLQPGPFRARHVSRVFGNLNRLRAEAQRLEGLQ